MSLQLQRLWLRNRFGDGSCPPARFRDDGDADDSAKFPSLVTTGNGTLILYVETDSDFEPKSTSVLGPTKVKPSELGATESPLPPPPL